MSHIMTIKTEVRDVTALAAACHRCHLPRPVNGSHDLYKNTAEGWGVQLPDWRYPVVCQTHTGQLHFDNFGGRWGQKQHLDRLLQAYAVERATIEVRRQGHSVVEQFLPDGSIKLTVSVGGSS